MGKSFLLKCLKKKLKDSLGLCSFTGCAAYAINGITCHGMFKINPNQMENDQLSPNALDMLKDAIDKKKYIVLDEVSMIGRRFINIIDQRCR